MLNKGQLHDPWCFLHALIIRTQQVQLRAETGSLAGCPSPPHRYFRSSGSFRELHVRQMVRSTGRLVRVSSRGSAEGLWEMQGLKEE